MRTRRLTVVLAAAWLVLSASGCSGSHETPTLAGTTWELVQIQSMDDNQGSTPVPEPGRYTVAFGEDGRAAFRIDCNRGNGSWQAEPSEDGDSGNLTFGPIATTAMMCPPPTIDQQVAQALPHVRGYLLKDGQLHLSLFADGGILSWRPA